MILGLVFALAVAAFQQGGSAEPRAAIQQRARDAYEQHKHGARERLQRGIVPSEEVKKRLGEQNPQPRISARFEAHVDTNPIRPAEQRYVQEHGSAAYTQLIARLFDDLFPSE